MCCSRVEGSAIVVQVFLFFFGVVILHQKKIGTVLIFIVNLQVKIWQNIVYSDSKVLLNWVCLHADIKCVQQNEWGTGEKR